MLKIYAQDYSKYITGYACNDYVCGEGVIETLSGGVYPYGNGICYDVSYVLEQIPSSVLSEIMQRLSGVGATFYATFLVAGKEASARCYAHDISTELQSTADDGYWKLTFTMTTTGW